MQNIPEKILSSLALARSSVYALEWLPTNMIGRLMSGDGEKPGAEEFKTMWANLRALHELEAHQVMTGVYPVGALDAETPWGHLRSYAGVLADGFRVGLRMRRRNHADFDAKAKAHAEGLPEYYARNFHFQTDGYLSEKSARRYDHQVDILFAGTAGAMRRQILPVLKRYTKPNGRILDLGAGTGSATKGVLATFPKARVTALDMSAPYLKVAQERLRRYPRVDYCQGDATELHFKDESFDAVYSVFVMHELPPAERGKLIAEAYRVLKPGGVFIVADSIQTGDQPAFDAALARFPRVYHEPFYAGYIKDRLEDRVGQITGQTASSNLALFTKIVWVTKPAPGGTQA